MFCKYCGKQVPDGETCTCAQATAANQQAASSASPVAAPAAPASTIDFGAILSKILGGFKALWKDTTCSGADMTVSAAFAVTGLLLHILSWLCLKSMVFSDVKIEGLTGKIVWCGCLSYLIPLVCFVLIPVVGNLIRKIAVDIKSAFGTAAAISVVPSALFLLGGVVGLVVEKLGVLVILIAVMGGITACTKLAKAQVPGKGALAAILVALIVAVMVGLTAYLEFNVIKEIISNLFASLLSGIFGGLGGTSGLGGLFG